MARDHGARGSLRRDGLRQRVGFRRHGTSSLSPFENRFGSDVGPPGCPRFSHFTDDSDRGGYRDVSHLGARCSRLCDVASHPGASRRWSCHPLRFWIGAVHRVLHSARIGSGRHVAMGCPLDGDATQEPGVQQHPVVRDSDVGLGRPLSLGQRGADRVHLWSRISAGLSVCHRERFALLPRGARARQRDRHAGFGWFPRDAHHDRRRPLTSQHVTLRLAALLGSSAIGDWSSTGQLVVGKCRNLCLGSSLVVRRGHRHLWSNTLVRNGVASPRSHHARVQTGSGMGKPESRPTLRPSRGTSC